jgi:PAS domain S-box-containing protein
MVQDNAGFMWFGTRYGLYRYDGYIFKVFVRDPENPKSLDGVAVQALFKDRDGVLWVACGQSLNKYDEKTETFTRYPIPLVIHITQDRAGLLWITTHGGLYRLDPVSGEVKRYSHDANDPSSLSSSDISYCGEDKEGNFWVATRGALDEFDRKTGKVITHYVIPSVPEGFNFYVDRTGTFWIFHGAPNPLAIFDRQRKTLNPYAFPEREPTVTDVSEILEDRNGELLLATHGLGLLKLDPERRKFIHYGNIPTDPQSLPQDKLDALFADREGNIWVAPGRMAPALLTTKPAAFKKLPRVPGTNIEPFVASLYQDHQGVLWIGTPEALVSRDSKMGRITAYRTSGPGVASDVIPICEDRSGNLWVGTWSHGLLRFDRQTGKFKPYRHNPADPYSLSSDIVMRLLVDHNGTLWAGTADGLDRFDPQTERFVTYKLDPQSSVLVLELIEDRDGKMWIGTESSGLRHFDPLTGQQTIYEHNANRPGTLSDNRVNSVHFDRSGVMWVGTQNGLDKLDLQTGMFSAITQRDGLPGNAVGCILEDSHGKLWMSTNNGIARFNPQSKEFADFSTSEGLPGPNLTGWGACFQSPSGEMFFGGFNGGTSFFPDNAVDSTYTPSVVLTDFRLFGNPVQIGAHSPLRQSISYTTDLTLPHDQNVFSIAFAGLSYASTATSRYRYRLEGLEPAWNEVGSDRRLAIYTTLPSGTYTFHVQAATRAGPWSEPGVALRIEILPSWWNTWWFRVLCIVAFFGLLWTFYWMRLRQVQSNERNLSLIVDTIPGQVIRMSATGEVELVNRQLLAFFGKNREDIKNWSTSGIVHPEDLPRAIEVAGNAFAIGKPYEMEIRVRRFDGAYRWVQARGIPLRDAEGRILNWYALHTDIDDRKRAEEALRASEFNARMIVDGIPGLVARVSPIGEVEVVNRPLLEYFGKDLEEVRNWAITDAIYPDDLPVAMKVFNNSLPAGDPFDVEHRLRRFDGEYRWFQSRGLPLLDRDGRILNWYVLLTDIEDRKRAEEALQSNERNLGLIINTMPTLVWSARPDGSAEFLNQHFLDYVGLPLEKLQGWGWTVAVHPEDLNALSVAWQAIMAAGKPGEAEARLRRFDGEFRWFLFRTNPMRDESGRIVKWYGTNTDIHDRKQAEAEVKESYLRLAEAQRLSKTGSFITDLVADQHDWSEETFRIFEFDSGTKVTVEIIRDGIHPEDLPSFDSMIGRAMTGKDVDFSFRFVTPRGAVKHIRGMARVIEHVAGRPLFIGALQDVTDSKVAEEALNRARSDLAHVSRVTTLNALTASIAHEINQPLTGIVTNASTCLWLLSTDPPDLAGARETAQLTIRDGNRASDVIERLRTLYGKKESRPESMDLNAATREVISLSLSDLQRNRIIVRHELADDLPPVTGDRIQLQQVILNLIRNASDAMSTIDDRPRELLIKTERNKDGRLCLRVKDVGVGFQPQAADKLFEAFYTTKEHGMGIGLNVSRSIIEAHHGHLWAMANDGPGATFSFSIPCSAAGAGIDANRNGRCRSEKPKPSYS